MAIKRFAEIRNINDPARVAAYRRSLAYFTEPRMLVAITFYAAASMLFFGAFIVRYRLELILTFPLVALVMALYLSLGFMPESAAQHPEKLYRQAGLMAVVSACFLLMVALLFARISASPCAVQPHAAEGGAATRFISSARGAWAAMGCARLRCGWNTLQCGPSSHSGCGALRGISSFGPPGSGCRPSSCCGHIARHWRSAGELPGVALVRQAQLAEAARRSGTSVARVTEIIECWFKTVPYGTSLRRGSRPRAMPRARRALGVRLAVVSDYEPSRKLAALGVASILTWSSMPTT